jgi:hypothetical protein
LKKKDWLQLNKVQPIADYCGKIFTVIDYISLLVHIIIPKCTKSIIVNQDQIVSLTYQQIIEENGFIFVDFQNNLQQTTQLFISPDVSLLKMLEILVEDNIIMISFNGIVNNEGNFHPLQYKTKNEKKQNSNNNNNNDDDINLSEYVGKNNLPSSSLALSSSLSLPVSSSSFSLLSLPPSSSLSLFSSLPPINIKQNNELTKFIKTLVPDQSSRSQLLSIENNNKRSIITKNKTNKI